MAENVLGHQSPFAQLTCAESIRLARDYSQDCIGVAELRDAVSR